MTVSGGAAPAPDAVSAGPSTSAAPDIAVTELANLLREERKLTERIEQQVVQARGAAAMWQERARNLEAQVEQLLVLPAHEEEQPGRRWWRFWR